MQTKRGAQAYERAVRQALLNGTWDAQRKEESADPAPTIEGFASVYLEELAQDQSQKPSTIKSDRSILNKHVLPCHGSRRIDTIRSPDFLTLRRSMRGLSGKRKNNVLAFLSAMVRYWYRSQDLDPPHLDAHLVKLDQKDVEYYREPEYEALVAAASADPRELVVVLAGGDAGLRMSEMLALHWEDLDLRSQRPVVRVRRSQEDGVEHSTKGRKNRTVRLTARLAQALRRLPRGLHTPYVLQIDGGMLTRKQIRGLLNRPQRRAGMRLTGTHILRHTFCTTLVTRGVPLRVVQELAGHESFETTLRYAHVAPDAKDDAIAALEADREVHHGCTEDETGS